MTYDQHIASDPEFSVWVAANAGTGKTKVLTDRVLRLLLAGSKPDKILCITYTKAASAEMVHRIETQLGEWAITDEKTLCSALAALTGAEPNAKTLSKARQLFALVIDAPERIRIKTIHSFCQSVLKRFPLEAGVAPHFTVIDERTSQELLNEAQRQLFNDPASDADVGALASMISEFAFDELMAGIIRDRKKFSRWFEKDSGGAALQSSVYGNSNITAGTTQEQLCLRHFSYSDAELKALRIACATLAACNGTSDRKTFEVLQAWLETARDLQKSKDYAARFLTSDGKPLKTLCTADAEKQMPGLKDILRAEQARVVNFMNELRSLQVVEATSHMIGLAEALLGIYKRLKDAHGYMDYDDIIAHTVALLTRQGAAAWVLYKLDGGIDHLLVDEAQDTSPDQWKLVEVLADEFFAGSGARHASRSLFVVGDGKQSIYSFQGADPRGFETMQSKLRKRIEASEKKFRNVQLALSFRSTEPVLQAVDEIFSRPSASDGLIFSESSIAHAANRKGMAGRVEIWPLTESAEEDETAHKPETILAGAIADEIRKWLDAKRKITSQNRLLQAGDILILVQRRSDFIPALTRALKKRDINVAGADRLVLTSHIAVEDCIALANFLLLPTDDMTLATVLKSPFAGLSEEDVFELAYDRKNLSLWQRLKASAKFSAAHAILAGLLTKVDYLPPYELFAYILETTGGRRKLAERLGTEIDDPLNEFLALAIEYSDMHAPSLQGFLHWLTSGETVIKRDMEKAKNEVRIMTVHGAKGLQAPIVFLPDTTRMPLQDSGILWSQAEEPIPLWSPSADHADTHYLERKEILKNDREREYRRLFYVAMTRAEDELYICGWKGKRAVPERCWYELARTGISDAWSNEDGRLTLTSAQTAPAKAKPEQIKQAVDFVMPDWVAKPPAHETALSKPLSPSRMDAVSGDASPLQDQTARLRGTLIHKLLQYMLDISADNREEAMQRFIERYGTSLSADMQEKIRHEVAGILQHPDFAAVFSADSIAEAPVSGITRNNDGQKVVVSGQIDRLAVVGDAVYIVDYKTGAHVPQSERDVPKPYIKQMEAYRNLVAQIYPDKEVHCALLWTTAPKLMLLTFSQADDALSQAS